MKARFCGESVVVLRLCWETETWFHSVVMKGDTCVEVCRIYPQKRFSGWCVWRGAPEILFNFVSKRQNRKFESDSPRKSRCVRTSVVEPNNLTRISEDLQIRKLSILTKMYRKSLFL